MEATLFNIPKFDLKTKMQEYSTSHSAFVGYDVTNGLKRTTQQ